MVKLVNPHSVDDVNVSARSDPASALARGYAGEFAWWLAQQDAIEAVETSAGAPSEADKDWQRSIGAKSQRPLQPSAQTHIYQPQQTPLSLTELYLADAIWPQPLACFDDPKRLGDEVWSNLSPQAQRRVRGEQPSQHANPRNPAGLYHILQQLGISPAEGDLLHSGRTA
ncbi:VC2046/SO_2500 family protein [Idiomarina tyrosinivorans]|uniref:VC2046/SO_2500 family protein n=1 Tax=Idiomarina tyrosinivorans TaxID=1445662 RepID=UPI00130042BD|nr:VC2046/SO_2500 family protein [Idiomarina tyrosinivorans]